MTTDVPNKRDLEEEILRMVSDSLIHLTQPVLERTVSDRFKAGRGEVRKQIRGLVEKGELEYTARYGCSFIERSFNRPVRISRRVVIKPEGITYQGNSEDVVISLFKGISFGTGRHPTTSLCVRAIDLAISRYPLPQGGRVLDIGTGSGILSIVALFMGLDHAEGTDYDFNARFEAVRNATINGLAEKMIVSDKTPDEFGCEFSLVTANLRFPTLQTLCVSIDRVSLPGAIVIISGIREAEATLVNSLYSSQGFECLDTDFEKGWCSFIFRKRMTNG